MVSLRTNVVALIAGLILLIRIDDAVPQACATMQTTDDGSLLQSGTLNWAWTGAIDTFDLDQDSNGNIAGTLYPIACSPNDYYGYSTTGTMNNSGGFSLSSAYRGSNPGCATTLTMSGTVSGAGCTAANGNWNNSSGLFGTF